MRALALLAGLALCAGAARADEDQTPPQTEPDPAAAPAAPPGAAKGPPRGWQAQTSLSGSLSLARRIEDRDDRARLAVAALGVQAELSHGWEALRLGLNVSAERAHYEWSRPRGLGAPELSGGGDPWREVQSLELGMSLFTALSRSLTLVARGGLGVGLEPGADVGQALSGGGGLALGYSVGPALTVGLGVFATTRLEDSPLVIPSLFLRWQASERLLVETTGPGVRVSWQASDALSLSGRAGFSFRQWRLDDRRARVPAGIVNDAAGELAAGLLGRLGPLSLTAEAGAVVWQELTVRDRRGELVRRLRGAPAPLLTLRLELAF